MKAGKAIAAIILSIALLSSVGLVVGLFSVDKALSEESLKESIKDSNIVQQLVDEVLAENTVNMGGKYGDITQAVFHSEPMNDFFAAYVTSAIRTELYGDPYEEVGSDELMSAFSQGVDEVNGSGQYEITTMEEEFLKQAMQTEVTDLTAKLNAQIGNYDTLGGELTEEAVQPDKSMQFFMSKKFRIISIIGFIVLCAGLIALYWKSKFGFLWCGIVIALGAGLFKGLEFTAGRSLLQSAHGSAAEEMLISMITGSFGTAAIGCAILALLFIVAFIIFKTIGRRKTA